MESLLLVFNKHSIVDIVSYFFLLYGDFLDDGVTNHVRICACVIGQFAQKYN